MSDISVRKCFWESALITAYLQYAALRLALAGSLALMLGVLCLWQQQILLVRHPEFLPLVRVGMGMIAVCHAIGVVLVLLATIIEFFSPR